MLYIYLRELLLLSLDNFTPGALSSPKFAYFTQFTFFATSERLTHNSTRILHAVQLEYCRPICIMIRIFAFLSIRRATRAAPQNWTVRASCSDFGIAASGVDFSLGLAYFVISTIPWNNAYTHLSWIYGIGVLFERQQCTNLSDECQKGRNI
jgi:hypothetical protein